MNLSKPYCLAIALVTIAAVEVIPSFAAAQMVNWESDPIRYSESDATRNPVAELRLLIKAGDVRIEGNDELSRLKCLLRKLDVPVSSQVLVFSKTSLQKPLISPATPRAIYFCDDVFVSYVPGGLVEIAVADPDLGAVFYTMDVDETTDHGPQRQANRCLSCHGAARTGGVPGFQIRSVFPNSQGVPVIRAGSFLSNHESPLDQRWGGWYVTGTHGDQRHLGGFILDGKRRPETIDNQSGQNQMCLPDQVKRSAYLAPTSDVTALMVLEHQVEAYNLLTQANFVAQYELWKAKDRSLDQRQRERIAAMVEPLVKYLCFDGEVQLTSPVRGIGPFATDFAENAEPSKRLLRRFEMNSRMFQHPISFLINGAVFEKLEPVLQAEIANAIWTRFPPDHDFHSKLTEIGPDWLIQGKSG